jgi:GTPase SAR1 family protein
MRQAACGIIVFDLTQRTTFTNVRKWIDSINDAEGFPFVVVGNKEDLIHDRAIGEIEYGEFETSVSAQCFTASAKTGVGVQSVFQAAEALAVARLPASSPGALSLSGQQEEPCC